MFAKQNLRFLFVLLCSVFLVSCVAEFGSISPDSAVQGEEGIEIEVTGIYTLFEEGKTEVHFSPDQGFIIYDVTVEDATTLSFLMDVHVDTPVGITSVTVVYDDGKQAITGNNVFEVVSSTTPPTQEITITLENTTCLPGSQSVEVFLENEVPVRGLQFTILDEYGYLTIEEIQTTSRTEGFSPQFNPENGMVVLISMLGGEISPGTGSMLTIEFTVSEDAPEGECIDLYLQNIKIAE